MNIKIDVAHREISTGHKTVRFPPRVFSTMEMLARAQGKVLSREAIVKHLLGSDEGYHSRSVDASICRLRRVLGKDAIRTVTGFGYAADGIQFVNEPKNYGAIRSIDKASCTAVIAVDFDTLPSLKVGGAVKIA